MSIQKLNNYRIEHPDFSIEISQHSGFCFGVVNAIKKADEKLANNEKLFCVGSIVHNSQEVSRLTDKGLEVISLQEAEKLNNKNVLFRAHGEPPESYAKIKKNNRLIDATCPVVLKIQQRIKNAWERLKPTDGQIVIYGKKNHAEVIGLLGQTNYEAILLENESDIDNINFNKPIELFSQTTKSIADYKNIANLIERKAKSTFKHNDTICRQVSNRQQQLAEFATKYEVIFFVGDPKSSNSKVLFETCKNSNRNTYFITESSDIDLTILKANSFGICGATSTPQWLMEDVAKSIEHFKIGIT